MQCINAARSFIFATILPVLMTCTSIVAVARLNGKLISF